MTAFRPRGVVLSTAFALASLSPALADRDPTPEEQSRIEQVLRAEGFISWGQIELEDDDVWDVENARTADGRGTNLSLDPTSFKIIRRGD
jgi:Peptidase propeptide and YPEB domain